MSLSPGSAAATGHTDAGGGWRDALAQWRDRLLMSPRFQRWAAAFPLTRPIAQRQARALFDLCAGFVYSQVLAACVRLKLIDMLVDGPLPARELAQRMGLTSDAADRLLGAAASLRLLERRSGGRYGLGMLGAAMAANPGIAAMVDHHAMLYDDLKDPVALLRGEIGEPALQRYWAYARSQRPVALESGAVAAYSDLMSASQQLVAGDILDAYPMARHRWLMDVGGGDGTFLLAAAQRNANLRLTLFDLPAVAARAEERFAATPHAARMSAVGGDFRGDRLPRGADLVTLVRVVHDHDDAPALKLLRNVRRLLPPDGVLVLAEPMAGASGAETVGEAYFAFYLLAMGSGRARTFQELRGMLHAAGFADVRLIKTPRPLQTSVIVARPGSGDRGNPPEVSGNLDTP